MFRKKILYTAAIFCFVGIISTIVLNPLFAKGVISNIKGDKKSETPTLIDSASGDSEEANDQAKQAFFDNLSLVYDFVQNNYYKDIDTNKMFEGVLLGMMSNLGDPYSTFISHEKAQKYQENIQGEFGGLGIYISEGLDEETGIHYIKVISPIEGTPAFFVGLQSGDLILSVEETSTAQMSASDAAKIMRGTPGTSITITVKRRKRVFPVTITREVIKVVDLQSAFIADNLAYIKVSRFTDNTPSDFKKAINKFDRRGYNTLLVDLRGNPGGSLKAVLQTADFFLGEGKIIVGTQARKEEDSEVFKSTAQQLIPNDKKIIVMINGGSASASEILSGALKDNNRGTLVGEKTFGKGLVQSVNPYYGGFLTMTISQYYTPSRTFINEVGIEPHIEVANDVEELTPEELVHAGKILENNLAQLFVEDKKGKLTENSAKEFKEKLAKEDGVYINNLDYLTRILYLKKNVYDNVIPAYSLELDNVLSQVVDKINKGDL